MNLLEEKLFQTAASSQWKQIGVKHHHGICLPLFSLHSQNSSGIGEFLDLLPLVYWCREIGLDVIQLLPLNDTGMDASPYNALSANALNPIHLSLFDLPYLENIPNFREKLASLRQWNQTQQVRYALVRNLKKTFLKEYFSLNFASFSDSEEYKNFMEQNKKWLVPYALFKSIKEAQEWKSWEDWPIRLKSPSMQAWEDLQQEYRDSCSFHVFIQFLCYSQMETVKREAEKVGLFIKGDIPILISRDSADVWASRHYFLLNLSAGAPPDMYSKDGQSWGFPVYDWEELEKQDYKWWKERLRVASHLYHLYRIDHVVGFFRIWTVPLGRSPKEGSFVPHDENQWIGHGKKIMEMMLKSAPILPIGEDLGVVPPQVKLCLNELGICGTKMMRWERRWEADGGFIPMQEYSPQSMTTVSTHDSDTLQLWWRHFPKEAKLFSEFKGWDYKPFLSIDRQREILWDCHHSSSLFHINLLQEYFALFPELVWPNPNDERINIPGKALASNWTYKFRPSMEEFMEHIPLKENLKNLIR